MLVLIQPVAGCLFAFFPHSLPIIFIFVTLPRLPIPPLFPYTTLFRSQKPFGSFSAVNIRGQHVPGKRQHRRRVIGKTKDRKSTRLNSSHVRISYAVFCLKNKKGERVDCELD